MSSVVSLFLLSQVFLIISHAPLVRQLADIIFNGDLQVCMGDNPDTSDSPQAVSLTTRAQNPRIINYDRLSNVVCIRNALFLNSNDHCQFPRKFTLTLTNFRRYTGHFLSSVLMNIRFIAILDLFKYSSRLAYWFLLLFLHIFFFLIRLRS